jgi:hypothetical protein
MFAARSLHACHVVRCWPVINDACVRGLLWTQVTTYRKKRLPRSNSAVVPGELQQRKPRSLQRRACSNHSRMTSAPMSSTVTSMMRCQRLPVAHQSRLHRNPASSHPSSSSLHSHSCRGQQRSRQAGRFLPSHCQCSGRGAAGQAPALWCLLATCSGGRQMLSWRQPAQGLGRCQLCSSPKTSRTEGRKGMHGCISQMPRLRSGARQVSAGGFAYV